MISDNRELLNQKTKTIIPSSYSPEQYQPFCGMILIPSDTHFNAAKYFPDGNF